MAHVIKRPTVRSLAIPPALTIVLGLVFLFLYGRIGSLQAPCHDPAAALQSLQANDTGQHFCFVVTRIQVDGNIVTGRTEASSDAFRARGIERNVTAFMAEVRDGRIATFFQRTDLADPQSALNASIAGGTAQAGTPIPTPSTACT